MVNDDFAMLFDSSYCMGCKACQVACKQENMLPSPMRDEEYEFSPDGYTYPLKNDGDNFLRMVFHEVENGNGPKPTDWVIARESCYHCTIPGCVDACPTGACHVVGNGSVDIDPSICIGCQFCTSGCPWSTPKYRERDNINAKCWFCQDRLSQDQEPACVKTCFPDALDWGYRSLMLKKAHERVEKLQEEGFADAQVFGEHEMGGLHLIQVLKYSPEVYGLKPHNNLPFTHIVSNLTKPIAAVGFMGALGFTLLSAKHWKGHIKPVLHYDPATKKTLTEDGKIWFEDEQPGAEDIYAERDAKKQAEADKRESEVK
ncbi:MAG: 4Fe-4S dicluster domain-containing protein [Coriobacteriia bacterium]|nr:4Fe-4S dicluster domain-containing protein [Coriobacteriia bacterium]